MRSREGVALRSAMSLQLLPGEREWFAAGLRDVTNRRREMLDFPRVNLKKLVAAAATILPLAACGGGGGVSNGGPSSPGPALDRIRALTNATPPEETAGDQGARSRVILPRVDSLNLSTVRGETSSPNLPVFAFRASCSGTSCTLTEPTTGFSDTIRLSGYCAGISSTTNRWAQSTASPSSGRSVAMTGRTSARLERGWSTAASACKWNDQSPRGCA